MSETRELTDAIILAVTEHGGRVYRNSSGIATYKRNGRVTRVRFGVGPVGGGGADLIGWTSDGRFLSIEIKAGKDRQTKQQKMWEAWVNSGGGRAGVARSVDDALVIMGVMKRSEVVK